MEVQYRITSGTEITMKGFAVFVYLVNLCLEAILDWIGIGLFLSPLFIALCYTALGLWFGTKKVSILGSPEGHQFLISGIISLIPVVNVFYFRRSNSGLPTPGIYASTVKLIKASQKKDLEEARAAMAGNDKGSAESQRYQRPSYRPQKRRSLEERGGNSNYPEQELDSKRREDQEMRMNEQDQVQNQANEENQETA